MIQRSRRREAGVPRRRRCRSKSPRGFPRERGSPEASGSTSPTRTSPKISKHRLQDKFKPPKKPPRGRASSCGTPATKPVPTPFAQGTSLAQAKEGDDSLEVASVADIAKHSVRAAALADAQSIEQDPLNLFSVDEGGSSCDEEGNTSSSDESMSYAKGALKDLVAAKESQRQHRKAITILGAPAPPHIMVAAAKRAAEPSDSSGDVVMVERAIDLTDL